MQLEEASDKIICENSRLDYLKNYSPGEYTVYDSFEMLANLVRKTYQLSYRA